DGIRSFHVTGVQTCALPISPHARWGSTRSHTTDDNPLARGRAPTQEEVPMNDGPHSKKDSKNAVVRRDLVRGAGAAAALAGLTRSEERRVGNAARIRWRV